MRYNSLQKRVVRFWACVSQALTKMVGSFASLSNNIIYIVTTGITLSATHNE